MRTHIDIRLRYGHQDLDLRVPSAISFGRLKELLTQLLEKNKVPLPTRWTLVLENKPIRLGVNDILNDFPIGNGDIFQIVVGEDYEGI